MNEAAKTGGRDRVDSEAQDEARALCLAKRGNGGERAWRAFIQVQNDSTPE